MQYDCIRRALEDPHSLLTLRQPAVMFIIDIVYSLQIRTMVAEFEDSAPSQKAIVVFFCLVRSQTLREATIIFVISVCPSVWNNSAPTGRIFMKLDIWVFFENLSRKLKFLSNLTRMAGTLYEELCTFIYPWILPTMKNVSDRIVEKVKRVVSRLISFSPENRNFYGIMWKNIVEPDRSQMPI